MRHPLGVRHENRRSPGHDNNGPPRALGFTNGPPIATTLCLSPPGVHQAHQLRLSFTRHFRSFLAPPLLACRCTRRGAPSARLPRPSVTAQRLPAGFRMGVSSTGPAHLMLGAAVAPLHDVYIAHPLPRHRLTGACRPSHRLDRSLDLPSGGRQRSTTCLRVTAAGRPGLCARQLVWYVACDESGPAEQPSASGATVNSRLDRHSPPAPSSKPLAAQTALQQQRGRIARRLRLPESRLAGRCDMAWD